MKDRRGCLICNTGIELGLGDPEVGDFVKTFFRDLAVLECYLERAVEQGQLDRSLDVASLATYLTTPSVPM